MKANVNPVLDYPVVRMNCACGMELRLSIGMMARNIPAVCDECGAKLAIDAKASAKSMQLLLNTMAKLERIQRAVS